VSYQIQGNAAPATGASLRELVQERRVAHGGWCMIGNAFATEIVSASGCEWVCLDLQHGLIGDEAMRLMVQAAAIRSVPVAVRVPWNEPAGIMRALDAGAGGVIVPMVNTAEDARDAVAATRYPPQGYRSWGPLRSLLADAAFDPARGNEQSVCIVMVETVEAFGNLEAILSVPGVDSVLVGPNDLAISHAGENTGAGRSEQDVAMIREIAAACERHGKAAGISCGDGAEARRYEGMGYTLLGLPADAALIGAGMAATLADARQGATHE
jgi:4-hydroxy-2-oxoheptanedioate aldolase